MYPTNRPHTRFIPAMIFIMALALRLFGIETQSMWADEGGTLALAARAPDVILRDTLADVHPPLYYWILHAWMGLFGVNVFAARGFSALCGALAVLVMYVLARRWFGPMASWIAGVAGILSPLAIHYSQEARMYALAMLLATLLFLVLDTWLTSLSRAEPARRTLMIDIGDDSFARRGLKPHDYSLLLLLYLLLAAALLMTHYFAVTIVAGAAFVGIAQIVKQQRYRTSIGFVLAHLPLAALYLAMVLASRSRISIWAAATSPTNPLFVLTDMLRTFSIGLNGPAGWEWWSLLFTGLLLVGLLFRTNGSGRLFAGVWLGVPLVLMILISLSQPYYRPRFLLPALPSFHILVGAGIARLIKDRDAPLGRLDQVSNAPLGRLHSLGRLLQTRILLLGTMLLLASASLPLYREWFDPSVWRDEYRGAARAIRATARADDVLILNGQSQIDTLNVYLNSPQPRILLPRFRPLDANATEADLTQLAAHYRRIYGLFYVIEESDPQGVMANWLDTHTFPSGSRWYGDIQLRTWETGDLSDQLHAINANIGGLHLLKQAIAPATLTPGDAVRVQLDWQAETAPEQPLSLFIHLLGAHGQLIAQYDGPLARQALGSGAHWASRMAVIIPPNTAPGRYQMVLGVYNPANGTRLNLADGADTFELGMVEVR
jgi:hypothetical protein